MTSPTGVERPWPPGLTPGESPVHARNELLTTVPAHRLWPVLLDAAAWPQWYRHASRVQLAAGTSLLELGTAWSWRTLGGAVHTVVREFEAESLLAWAGTGPLGSRGYHRWILTPTSAGGTSVVTEEVQQGPLPRVAAPVLRGLLLRFHQHWLEALVEQARPEGDS